MIPLSQESNKNSTKINMKKTEEKQGNRVKSRMYLADVIEESENGSRRETLWYGGSAENLGLLIIDVMKDWYEPNKDELDESILKYHDMLQDKKTLTFDKLKGLGFCADGMKLFVRITNDINDIFSFVLNEICDIFAKDGENMESFESLEDFKQHFTQKYDMDEEFKMVMEGINEVTLSRALLLIDIKYDFTGRHFKRGFQDL